MKWRAASGERPLSWCDRSGASGYPHPQAPTPPPAPADVLGAGTSARSSATMFVVSPRPAPRPVATRARLHPNALFALDTVEWRWGENFPHTSKRYCIQLCECVCIWHCETNYIISSAPILHRLIFNLLNIHFILNAHFLDLNLLKLLQYIKTSRLCLMF